MTPTDAAAAPERVLTVGDITAAAQLACLLEVSAPKPGNVSPGRDFANMRFEDFLVSAVAIGEPLAGAGGLLVAHERGAATSAGARSRATNLRPPDFGGDA